MNSWTVAPVAASGHDAGAAPASFAVRPAVGLLGVAAGTLAAVVLVPESEHYARGALVPSALVLAVGLLAGPVASGLRHPAAVFRLEHLLLFGLVYWLLLDALQTLVQLRDVSRGSVQGVFLYAGLFAAGLWVGSAAASFASPGRRRPAPAPDVSAGFLFGAGVLCFVFGFAQSFLTCSASPVCVVEALFAPRFQVPWYAGPGIKGLNQVLAYLKYFGYLLPAIVVALYLTEGRLTRRTAVLAPLAFAFLLLLLRDGGRRELGSVLGAAMLTWLLLRPRPTARHFAALLGGAAGLLLLLQLMVSWRDVGVARILDERPAPKSYGAVVVDWNFDWMAHAIEVVPERAPHVGWNGIVYVLGYPIPRSLWPAKPPLHGIDLPAYLGRQYGRGFSWNCSVVCDLYLIGGALAVSLGGMLYGALANGASRLLFEPPSARTRLLYAVIAMALFLTLRTLIEFMAQGMTVLAFWGLLQARLVLLRLRSRA
jgi:hypothetical protein